MNRCTGFCRPLPNHSATRPDDPANRTEATVYRVRPMPQPGVIGASAPRSASRNLVQPPTEPRRPVPSFPGSTHGKESSMNTLLWIVIVIAVILAVVVLLQRTRGKS